MAVLARFSNCRTRDAHRVGRAAGRRAADGTFLFTPPPGCQPGVPGAVAIDVFWTAVSGQAPSVFRATVPYRVDGTIVTLGDGLVVGGLSGMAGTTANMVAIIGGQAQTSIGVALAGALDAQAPRGHDTGAARTNRGYYLVSGTP